MNRRSAPLLRTGALSLLLLIQLHAASYPPYPATIHGFGTQNVPNLARGADPDSTLIETAPGVFYGTTASGGKYQCGILFKITSAGAFTKLHDFFPQEGCYPTGQLVQAADGMIYGTTTGGPFVPDNSSLFRSDLAGDVTILSVFPSQTLYEYQAPTLAADGSIYTVVTVFSEGFGVDIFPIGAFVLHFALDGTKEQVGDSFGASYVPTPLILASDGNLYGLNEIQSGSVYNLVIYRVNPSGIKAIFSVPDSVLGDAPVSIGQGSDSKLYFATDLTLASTSLTGKDYTLLDTFPNVFCEQVQTGFVLGSDGQLYFGCSGDLATQNGAILTIPPDAGGDYYYTSVFGGAVNLASQSALAVEGMDGDFYGAIRNVADPDETSFYGSIYSLATGLPAPKPAVNLLTPSSGASGTAVTIYGNYLLGPTAVSFNGVPAQFSANSVNLITAVVPVGASTGDVTVTTANGTGASAGKFDVSQ